MRLFIGLFPEKGPNFDEIIHSLHSELHDIEGKFSFVPTPNVHCTLQFLGEVAENKVDDVTFLLNEIKFENFTYSIRGLGVFPPRGRPRVVWLGVGEGYQEIIDLAKQIHHAMKQLGFPKEKRFHPHLTIARVKYLKDFPRFEAFMEKHKSIDIGVYQATHVSLIQSTLTPQGAKYDVLKDFPLS